MAGTWEILSKDRNPEEGDGFIGWDANQDEEVSFYIGTTEYRVPTNIMINDKFLQVANDLSELSGDTQKQQNARDNIGISAANTPYSGTLSSVNVKAALDELESDKLESSDNLSDLNNASSARTNLGISAANTPYSGTLSSVNVKAALDELDSLIDNLSAADISYSGTASASTVKQAIDQLDANSVNSSDFLQTNNNLSDVDNAATALGNIFTAGSGITRSGTTVSVSGISQSNLNTTIGEVSMNDTSFVELTLPGGEYGFYPQVRINDSSASAEAQIAVTLNNTAFSTNIALRIAAGGGTPYAQQRYIQSSPPYDLGDGEIPLFTFALVSPQGDVISTYTAEDPPWANNGPTNTRPDVYRREKRGGKQVTVGYQYRRRALSDDERKAVVNGEMARPEPELVEVDQSIKNADIDLIPHPFANAPSDHTVVLLDPVSTQGLHELHLQGESIAELLHGGYVGVDNEPIKRCCPNGVQPCRFRWKGGK